MTANRGIRFAIVTAIATSTLTSGCTVTVVAGVDDPDANKVVAALEGQGIAAEKSQDPGANDRFKVDVPRAESARAVTVLGEQGLPPPKIPGMQDALGSGALVPSRAAEHERLLAGKAGELERTLRDLDGVVSARVHLAIPRRDPLNDGEAAAPSASVLLRYRGKQSPIAETDVQRLVTFAVPGLESSRVFVAAIAAPSPAARDLERFGPLTTTRVVARQLRVALFALALLGLALTASLVYLWNRARRSSRKARPRLVARAESR